MNDGSLPLILGFVRHAEAVWTGKRLPGRLPAVDLSTKGREQAADLAKHLVGLPVRALYASPLERTMHTAGAIAEELAIPVVPVEELLEADCGSWAGRTFKQVQRLASYKELRRYRAIRTPPGGESASEVQARMLRFVDRVLSEWKTGLVLAVSHADPIKVAIAALVGIPLESYPRLEVGVASVSAVRLDGEPSLLCLNADGARFATLFADLETRPPTARSAPSSRKATRQE